MKAFFALFALVAAVAADADPQLFYAANSVPVLGALSPFTSVYKGVTLKSAPCVNNLNVPVACAQGMKYYAYTPALSYTTTVATAPLAAATAVKIVKREADAEPQPFFNAVGAVTAYGAYAPFTTLYNGVTLKSAPCVNNLNMPVACAAGYSHYINVAPALAAPAYGYNAYNLGYSLGAPLALAKRDADADADPALLYAGAYGALPALSYASPLTYGAPIAYGAQLAYGAPLVKAVHPSLLGICLNVKGEQVHC